MIRKQYKPDGSPDLRRWMVQCDICAVSHTLTDTTTWCIPANPNMPDYCPFCTNVMAAHLIETAFT
jgi:hypothetical protein